MTWQPRKPEQSGLGFGESRKAWPQPTPAKKPVRRAGWSQVAAPDDPWGQTARMWEFRRRMAARLEVGEAYEAAYQAVRRELWPDEFQGE